MKINHKYLSIVLLVLLLFVLFLNNKKENFTDAERKNALDNLKTQNDLFRGIFKNVSNNDVTLGKELTNPVLSGIKLSNKWSSYPDNSKDRAEISNDRGTYKALMIVGNKSAGSNRKVRLYDELKVHGKLHADSEITSNSNIKGKQLCLDGVCINKEHLRALKGERDIFIKSRRVNKYLQSGDFTTNVKGSDHSHNLRNAAEFDGGGKGHWEQLRLEL